MTAPPPIAGKRPVYPLRVLRRARGLTLGQVAKRMRTSVPDLSRLESGQILAGEEYVVRYAEAIGASVRRVRTAYWIGVQMHGLRLLQLAHDALERQGRKG